MVKDMPCLHFFTHFSVEFLKKSVVLGGVNSRGLGMLLWFGLQEAGHGYWKCF